MLQKMIRINVLILIAFVFAASAGAAEKWVERSNENAKLLLDVFSKYTPEFASQLGVEGVDENIIDLNPGFNERANQDTEAAIAQLRSRWENEKDRAVKQDLEILIKTATDAIKSNHLNRKYLVPYYDLSQTFFLGLRALLDDQVEPERRKAALVRLKKYAGMQEGYKPVTVLATERIREQMHRPGLLFPSKPELEKVLINGPHFISGIEKLFQKYSITGYEEAYTKLKEQTAEYENFLKSEIQTKARPDFRLPRPLYEFTLQQYGVMIDPETLAKNARTAFEQIQKEMQVVAGKVAKEKGYTATDYRDVIKELKKKQIVGDAILAHYQSRIKDIEKIIRDHKIVTLPKRDMTIRIASEAESASIPAPNMRPPRMMGNTGEKGEFVLPLNIPAAPGSKEASQKFDDFTFEAASWTLTAHEGRPGHEMQFASVVEKGVSIARAVFSFNIVNMEGWGLYSEWLIQPYEPAEGELICLQHRLMRAARAFLDPELQLGKMEPEQAKALLMNDVVLSEAMANQEVERYTFWAPGQAPSYFYGYTKLRELRNDAEKEQGQNFNPQAFHDFILAQGMVSPELLREAVQEVYLK
jgi:hypothetical protein